MIQTKFLKDCGRYHTYGIAAVERDRTVRAIEDISTDKEKIDMLVKKFNRESLHLNHFEQAVEEFLYDFEV